MDKIEELASLLEARIEYISSFLWSKFDIKLMITNENQKEVLFNNEFDIINKNIEGYYDKYEDLIHEYLFDVKRSIKEKENNFKGDELIHEIEYITENRLSYWTKWAIEGYLNISEINSVDFKNFDLSKFHSIKEKENISSLFNINNIDEIERVLSWISYYFQIYLRNLKFKQTNASQNQSNLKGFDSTLKSNQIDLLYNELINNKYIHQTTKLKNFQAAFCAIPFPYNFEPIKWIVAKYLLRMLLVHISNDTNREGNKCISNKVKINIIPELFKDKYDKKMIINNTNKKIYENNTDPFENILSDLKKIEKTTNHQK
jgi:hypothetical protein